MYHLRWGEVGWDTEDPQVLYLDLPDIPFTPGCFWILSVWARHSRAPSKALNHGPHTLIPSKCCLNPHLPQPPGPPASWDPFGLESVSHVCRQMHPDHTMHRWPERRWHTLVLILRGWLGLSSGGPQPPNLPLPSTCSCAQGDTGRELVRDISAHPRPSGPVQRCPSRVPHPEAWGRQSPTPAGNLSFSRRHCPCGVLGPGAVWW